MTFLFLWLIVKTNLRFPQHSKQAFIMREFKLFLPIILLSIAIVGYAFIPNLPVKSVDVDTKASVVNWKGYKVTGEHYGTVQIKSGSLQFEGEVLVGGTFEMDMTSIIVTDIQGSSKTRLENHLKSDDFFGTDKYPVSKFKITRVVSRGTPGSYKVIGNLTIKETTKEIRFDANVKNSNGTITAEADIRIDRSEFNVKYGSGSFFDSLGDKTIYDEFDIGVKLVAR